MRTPQPWTLPTEPISASTLSAMGVSRQMVETALRSGALLRLRHGVYLAGSAWPPDPDAQHLAKARAELAANPDAVLSHQSAAIVWRLPHPGFQPWHEQPVAITSPPGAGHRSRAGTVERHSGEVDARFLERDPAGYPVTSPTRTAVDLAARMDLPDQLVVLDAVARRLCAGFASEPRRRDFTNPRLISAARELIAEAASDRHQVALLAAIERAHPARESAAESLTAGHLFLAGLPEPEYQVPIRTPAGLVFPDFLWRCAGRVVVGECDGAVKYSTADGSVREKVREQLLRDLGFAVVRWLATEIMLTPWVVIDRIARALEA